MVPFDVVVEVHLRGLLLLFLSIGVNFICLGKGELLIVVLPPTKSHIFIALASLQAQVVGLLPANHELSQSLELRDPGEVQTFEFGYKSALECSEALKPEPLSIVQCRSILQIGEIGLPHAVPLKNDEALGDEGCLVRGAQSGEELLQLMFPCNSCFQDIDSLLLKVPLMRHLRKSGVAIMSLSQKQMLLQS